MQRNYLSHGYVIELNNKAYTIDTIIGDGATCVVYSAEYADSVGKLHHVNIKECYPYNAKIRREGVALAWEDANEKKNCLTAFCDAYEKLMSWQDVNEIINVFDICEANNTGYIIMEPNKKCVTFDKDKPESLVDILKTIKLLAHYVGKYHQNGYLHLDIKPNNFLVFPRPSEHIVLFDLDTVTAISDIETGKCRYASYSDGWAAPEQKQGKINKLCPATDIYAIGAVLFEKIMDRQVNNDDIGCFAEWSFDGELFENINPKIKRLLTNIFKKTLAASIKRRYQTAECLVKDLEEAIKIAESEVYLKGDDICCSRFFVGRENELKCIKESFDNKKKTVFLHGFGGIGKTEIARKYAEIYKKNYDIVLFVKYDSNSTLQEKLDEICIANFDGGIIEHRKKLHSLLDDKTLVIVDNFDVEIGADNGLSALFDTKAQILVSTRTDFSSIYDGDKYIQIEVTELASNELEQVFFSNAKINGINKDDKLILYKIFKLVENHTYATELLAKQMYYSGWSLEILHKKIKSGFASLETAEKIVTNKDEDTTKDNSLNILRAVYRISNLTEAQKQVLQNVSLLSFVNLNRSIYQDLTAAETLNPLNELIEIGLIQNDGVFLSLHKLVADLIKLELNPCWDECVEVYNYIFQQVEKFTEYEHLVYDADIDEAEYNGRFLYCFFKSNGLSLSENSKLAIHWLNKLVYIDSFFWFYLKVSKDKQNKFECFLDSLEAADTDAKNSIGVNYIRCIICLEKCEKIPANQKKYSFKDKQLESKIVSYFDAVKKLSEQTSNGEEILRALGDMIFNTIHVEQKLVPLIVVRKYYNYFSSYYQFTHKEKCFYDIPLNATDRERQSLDKFIRKSEHYQIRVSLEAELNELLDEFLESSYKYDMAEKVANSSQYNKQRKLQIINVFLDAVFEPLFRCFYKDKANAYIAQVDWAEINLIIDLLSDIHSDIITPSWDEQRTLKFSYGEDSYSDEYESYWDEYDADNEEIDTYWDEKDNSVFDMTIVYKTIISLILGVDNFPTLMSKVDKYNEGTQQDNNDFSEGLYRIMHICYLIDKCWIVVPYMFQALVDILPDRINESFWIDVRAYYPMIRQVADYAKFAKEEMADNSRLSEDFTKIYTFADNLANLITNKTFDITTDIED